MRKKEMNNLKTKKVQVSCTENSTEFFSILKLREKIDDFDLELVKILKKRQDLVSLIIEIKKKEGIPIEDLDREERIVSKLFKQSEGRLSRELIEGIYKAIFNDSKI